MHPATILSCFLSAGKVTLHSHILRNRKAACAAVIASGMPDPFPAWGAGPS